MVSKSPYGRPNGSAHLKVERDFLIKHRRRKSIQRGAVTGVVVAGVIVALLIVFLAIGNV